MQKNRTLRCSIRLDNQDPIIEPDMFAHVLLRPRNRVKDDWFERKPDTWSANKTVWYWH